MLLNFLRVRAVVDGKEIYMLPKNQKVMITVMHNNPKVVITDGFHVTKPVELVYHHLHAYYFKVVCAFDNTQLIAGSFLVATLFVAGLLTGFMLIKLFSFMPIVYFLFYYYINRKDFLQITPV